MDELHGDRATWQFDGRSVHIRYHAGRSQDRTLKLLGESEVPVPVLSSVDFTPRARRKRWDLRLRLHDGADPYAAVGAMPGRRVDPFRLTGPAKTELLAEYWADQLALAVRAGSGPAGSAPAPAETALRMVPPVPIRVQTSEGSGSFDGSRVVLVWSGSSASARKRKEQRQELALADLRGVEWVPSDGWEWGYLRLLPVDPPAGPLGRPKHDLHTLRCNEGKEESDALLLAATITAHLWSHDPRPPVGTGAASEPETEAIYERIRQLGQLHAEGILTQEEFAAKKAELLRRL